MRIAIWTVATMTLVACGSAAPEIDAGVADAAPDAGVLDCLGILDCARACEADDTACAQACIARGTPDAVREITAVAQCASDHGCDDDESCIRGMCPSEVASCTDAEPMIHEDSGVDAGTDAAMEDEFPVRIEGMTRDMDSVSGDDSIGTDVFVRDDAAGEANGFPISRFAFYRLQHISYHATTSLMTGGCVITADATEDFTDPSAFENNLVIEREVGADGLHAYGFSIGLNVNHMDGTLNDCSPLSVTHSNFSSGHYVTHGTVQPRTDLHTFNGSAPQPGRDRTWDLHGIF